MAAVKTDDAACVGFRLGYRSTHRVERMPLTAISAAELPRNSRRRQIRDRPGSHLAPRVGGGRAEGAAHLPAYHDLKTVALTRRISIPSPYVLHPRYMRRASVRG